MKTWLLRPPAQDDLIQVLPAWRVWLLATFMGAFLGFLFYVLAQILTFGRVSGSKTRFHTPAFPQIIEMLPEILL